MAQQIQVRQCQFCGGSEFVEAYQNKYAALTGKESMMTYSKLNHTICRNCGSVVRSYVENPEKLLKRSNRR